MPLNWVWLKMLNRSQRNSNDADSLIAKRLNKLISKLVRRGLVRELRPELPNVSPCGAANASGLYSLGPTSLPLVTPDRGSPTLSANDPLPTPLATPAASE